MPDYMVRDLGIENVTGSYIYHVWHCMTDYDNADVWNH